MNQMCHQDILPHLIVVVVVGGVGVGVGGGVCDVRLVSDLIVVDCLLLLLFYIISVFAHQFSLSIYYI